MAKVRNNIFVRGLNGDLGKQFLVTTSKTSGRTTVSAKTDFEKKRERSEAQKAHLDKFSDAIFYAQTMKGEEVYRIKADGTGKKAYNIAIADWWHAPEVKELDLSAWRGAAGKVIKVRAVDDIMVKSVTLKFTDATGKLLEEGPATQLNTQYWEYKTKNAMTGVVTITVTATDLPGHAGALSRDKNVNGS